MATDPRRRGVPPSRKERTRISFDDDPDLVVEVAVPSSGIAFSHSKFVITAPPGSTLEIRQKRT